MDECRMAGPYVMRRTGPRHFLLQLSFQFQEATLSNIATATSALGSRTGGYGGHF